MIKWLLFFFVITNSFYAPQQVDISIKIDKLKNQKGNILVAIFKTKEGFPQETSKAYKLQVFKANQSNITIKNIPRGKYSISIVHDENSNGKVDYTILRVPKEGYGFSNIKKPGLYVPTFEKTLVNINNDTAIRIPLYYFYK